MIEVKKAVEHAATYFVEFMGNKVRDVMLEEVELSDDERFWSVTLSGLFPVPIPATSPALTDATRKLAEMFRPDEQRIYRTFKIDAETGAFKGMRNRNL